MTILNIGSINRDRVFHVHHFPARGETLTASRVKVGLGGKGLNHSVAIHRTGGKVRHLGAIGHNDEEIRSRIAAFGLSLDAIVEVEHHFTGSAQILVDETGENQIVLDPGAKRQIPLDAITSAIDNLVPERDWLLMQNESNGLVAATTRAKFRNIRVALAAAPFEAGRILSVLANLDLLAVNAVEFEQLCQALGGPHALLSELTLFVSRGADGAELRAPGTAYHAPSMRVPPVDTTGAGESAFGAFLARLDLGEVPQQALAFAMVAGGLQVTRPGAAQVIPHEAEILDLQRKRQG